jgi:hypothetical protein
MLYKGTYLIYYIVMDRDGYCSVALTKGKDEIEKEVMRKVPKLLSRGGYVPGVDHATPCDVPFENFCYLIELLRRKDFI